MHGEFQQNFLPVFVSFPTKPGKNPLTLPLRTIILAGVVGDRFSPLEIYNKKGVLPMLEHHDRLNGSATAFIRAFSDLIKDSTSHLATKDDIDTINKNMHAQFARQDERIDSLSRDLDTTNKTMQAQFARQDERLDSLSRDLDTTNKNMQAQFARQEEKIAEFNRNMRAQFAEQEKKITEINRKLD